MAETTKTIEIYGVHKITLHRAEGGGCSIHTNLHAGEGDDGHYDNDSYNTAIDAMESLILAHFEAGVDVTAPEYVKGVRTSIDMISNNT